MGTVVTTRRSGIEFHHPIAFWVGTLMLGAGVCVHIPMFMMAAPSGFKMVDMPVDGVMIAGMFLIVAGLILSVYGLIPRHAALTRAHGEDGPTISPLSADNAPLTRAHGTLFIVLIVALVVDIMKPATLGFVIPGMADEYSITRQTASWLAITALTGTAVGSVIWGLIADTLGRRCAILISSLMFVGTAMLIPYATEIYPVQVRGTGSGLVAGSSKAGGIAAAGLGVMGLFGSLTVSSLSIAAVLVAGAAVLAVKGIETRDRDLEDIYPGNSKETLTLPSEK